MTGSLSGSTSLSLGSRLNFGSSLSDGSSLSWSNGYTAYSLLGPALPSQFTFSRASAGTYWIGTNIVSAASGVPRFEAAGGPLGGYGLLLEPQSQNAVTNNTNVGAAVGTPGTPPTGWTLLPANGITVNVVNIGTESGIPFIDLAYSGTCTGTYGSLINPGPITQTASQMWTLSVFVELVSGTFNSNLHAKTQYNDVVQPNPTTSPLISQRMVVSGAAASTGSNAYLYLLFLSGNTYNFTIRIGGFQMEQQGWASSLILTSGSAVTRAADTLSLAPPSWWQTPSGMTMAMEFDEIANVGSQLLTLTPGLSLVNQINVANDGGGHLLVGAGSSGGVATGALAQPAVGTTAKMAVSIVPSGALNFALGGALATAGNAGAIPAYGQMGILSAGWSPGTNVSPGHARRLKLWNTPLSAAALTGATQ